MKRLTAILAVVVALLGLSGCGVALDDSAISTTGADLNPQSRENLRDGGSLTTAITEVSPQWNTFHADGTAYTLLMWRWYNPTLAYFAPDGTYSFNRDFLTDVRKELVDGKTVVTYTVNPKAHYNDGTPIDYRAFVNTWRTSSGTDPNYIVSATDGYDQIESVTRGVDDRQAVVRFKGVWAWPDGLFNILLHPKVNSADVYNTAYLQNPHPEWGAGPYTIDSYDQNTGVVVFKRNPQWWGNRGKLDRRVFRQMEDQAAINAFRNGEIDAIGVASKDSRAQVITMGGVDIRTAAAPQQSLLVVNLDTPILADRRVREAVLRGVDRETLARIRFTGLNYTEPLPGSLQMYSFQPGYEDNVKGVIDYDAGRAAALLDEAGWVVGDDGVRVKDGRRLALTLPILSDAPAIQNLARAFQAILKKIGVDVVIAQRPSSDFSKVVVNKEFDLFLMGFASSDPFGMAYLCQTWCEGSQLNKAGAGYPELDAEIARVAAIPDPMQQIAAGNKVERQAFAQYSDLPLFNGPSMVAVKEDLANYGAGQFNVGPVEDIGWQK
ncbi:ABC transporter family substrate-binding protein [Gordonia insulae]|uniref:Putative monoacyl phosphatidylinositol tetramannoside-binding protein LpqW n=1 Tax=Gordonia insulae TaxID=2420509 RepID=A0A3G8JMI9_9ACTN|nr:ABC transporter family substrate-binding protein [Gordonia insulae]AZG46301.1 putative monoacyl phosphatidylinositol tetramannoside-binding protein LpqW [Gordonia insulae]